MFSWLLKTLISSKQLTDISLISVRQRREVTICEDDEIVADNNCECAEGSSVGQTGACVKDVCKFIVFSYLDRFMLLWI